MLAKAGNFCLPLAFNPTFDIACGSMEVKKSAGRQAGESSERSHLPGVHLKSLFSFYPLR